MGQHWNILRERVDEAKLIVFTNFLTLAHNLVFNTSLTVLDLDGCFDGVYDGIREQKQARGTDGTGLQHIHTLNRFLGVRQIILFLCTCSLALETAWTEHFC